MTCPALGLNLTELLICYDLLWSIWLPAGSKHAIFVKLGSTNVFSLLDFSNSLRWIEEVFKIPLSFHYTGWLMGIPLLDYYNPQYMKGSIIPKLISNQHLSVTSTHIFIFLMVKKIHSHSGEKSSTNRGFEHKITWGLRPTRTPGTLRPRLRRGSVASRIFQKGKSF